MWMVVFNHPEHCIDGCDEPDLFVADVEGDVLYTAGHVIGGSGHATFAGHRSVGDANGSLFALFGLPSPGLIDASTAEIHFVMRTHGLAIPALLPDMIHTFNGGCGGLDASFGAPGPNTCTDIQFAVHQP